MSKWKHPIYQDTRSELIYSNEEIEKLPHQSGSGQLINLDKLFEQIDEKKSNIKKNPFSVSSKPAKSPEKRKEEPDISLHELGDLRDRHQFQDLSTTPKRNRSISDTWNIKEDRVGKVFLQHSWNESILFHPPAMYEKEVLRKLNRTSFSNNDVSIADDGTLFLHNKPLCWEGLPSNNMREALWALCRPEANANLPSHTQQSLNHHLVEFVQNQCKIGKDKASAFLKITACLAAAGALCQMSDTWDETTISSLILVASKTSSFMVAFLIISTLKELELNKSLEKKFHMLVLGVTTAIVKLGLDLTESFAILPREFIAFCEGEGTIDPKKNVKIRESQLEALLNCFAFVTKLNCLDKLKLTLHMRDAKLIQKYML